MEGGTVNSKNINKLIKDLMKFEAKERLVSQAPDGFIIEKDDLKNLFRACGYSEKYIKSFFKKKK